AVKILVGKGLLEVRRGIGTKVRERDQWLLLDDDVLAWHLSAPPAPEFLAQLMEIRLAFEPKAARWAAERATEQDMQEIHLAYQEMVKYEYAEANEFSVTRFIKADAKFHRAILLAANNEFLKAMEGVIYSALLVSIHITNKDPLQNGTSLPFHYDVYKAITERNGTLAEQLTDKLLRDACSRLQSQSS
ncbi:FadR/GntR family transcriptional regulator, partial [Paraglaciecola hydrolytica]